MSNYDRVLPRDLFNEAKLLKCIGQLCLKIHDGGSLGVTFDDNNIGSFDIVLLDDGHLYIRNINFYKNGNIPLLFKTTYNSKRNYPLLLDYNDVEYEVFDESGNYTYEYITFIESLK